MTTTRETFTAKIQGLDKKGLGQAAVWREDKRGRRKKLKLTIPGVLPGEIVRVSVDRPQRKRSKGRMTDILRAHPGRTASPCPHFDRCGGCVWQHWQYVEQLKQKTEHVQSALKKEGFDPGVVRKIIGMPDPWHYRYKMEFTFAPDGSLGLHEQGNYRNVIALDTCLIASRDIVDGAMLVAKWAKEHGLEGYDKDTHQGLLRHLMVRQSRATGEMMLALFATEAPTGDLERPAADLVERIQKDLPQVKSVLWMENTKWADRVQAEQIHVLAGRDFIYEKLAGYQYRLWYDTFFQTNPAQAEWLIKLALEFGEPRKTDNMIDLFCGVGTFSLPFASRVKALAGVEIVEKSIESAQRNARDNGVANTTFLAADARRGIDRVLECFGRPDLLLLDPPRSGAGGKVMRKIGRAKPDRIVYVSCNPDTLATDIAELAPFGYTLHTIQPVDMFPHTVHVECVAQLVFN